MTTLSLLVSINIIIIILIASCLTTNISIVHASSAAGQDTLVGVVGKDFIMLGADSSSSSSIALTSSNLDKILVLADPFPNGRQRQRQRQRQRRHESDTLRRDDYNNAENEDNTKIETTTMDPMLERARYIESFQQKVIVAAAAGDAADADRLLGILAAHAAVREYEAGIGCDVEYIFDGKAETSVTMGGEQIKQGGKSFTSLQNNGPLSPAGLDAEAIAYLARGEIASSLRSGRGHLRVCLLIAGMVRCSNVVRTFKKEEPLLEGTRVAIKNKQRNDKLHALGGKIILDDDFDDETGAEFDSLLSSRIQLQVETASKQFRKIQKAVETVNKNDKVSTASTPPALVRKPSPQQFLEPRLFWLDEYGSLQNLEYGAHGYGANFALSILDQGYRKDLTREEAVALIRDCFEQLRTRYVINSPQPPCIKCVDANGCMLVR